ncbi:MAG: HNH endonuclease family protein [Verrucomicrobiia bacterium]
MKNGIFVITFSCEYGHKEPASLNRCQIEHVFPQSPDAEWREKLGDEAFSTAWQANDRIGNLTLTAYNPSLSNKWFEKKKQIYSESNVQLNRYFEHLQSWDAEQIDQRGRALFEKAKLLWAKPEAVPGVNA